MGAKVIGASEQSYSVQGQMDTPVFGHKYEMNDEEWDTFCTGMNKLGKIAKRSMVLLLLSIIIWVLLYRALLRLTV